MLKQTASWLGRKFILYLLLVVGLGLGTVAIPHIREALAAPHIHVANAAKIDGAIVQLTRARAEAQARLNLTTKKALAATSAELEQRLRASEAEQRAAIDARRSAFSRNESLLRLDTKALVADRLLELQIDLRTREIAALNAAKAPAKLLGQIRGLQAPLIQQTVLAANLSALSVRTAQACTRAKNKLQTFDNRWAVDRLWREARWAEETDLKRESTKQCGAADRTNALARGAVAARRQLMAQVEALRRIYRNGQIVPGQLSDTAKDLQALAARERVAAEGAIVSQIRKWAIEWHVTALLTGAALALIGIIFVPFLIRSICFIWLARLAESRPGIRLAQLDVNAGSLPTAERATASVSVRLEPSEELLVRSGYLQSTSFLGGKRTRWLLDWRHPLSSLAAGLSFLVAIRGASETTTVSAVHDALAEVTILTIPEGSACVLKPRAIAAVAQVTNRPMRISSKWRLGSLHAWLNLQFRYLIFHGPVRIVVKGNRGVRVERAERGRVFGREQLVGFSADLSYSVARTETFWPYFFGRESLLKDRVEAGSGVIIIEEAPMAGKRPGEARHGIEGAIDAALKVVGL